VRHDGYGLLSDDPLWEGWFGDFRGVIPGRGHVFCIDLRFWYASPAYRYRERDALVLRNRDGELVGPVRQHELAYALWAYGRGDLSRRLAAALMLYVHALMGDACRDEVSPSAMPRVARVYRTIARSSATFHGPYRLVTMLPAKVAVGRPAMVAVVVRSATGAPLPNASLVVSARGAAVPPRLRANAAGRALLAVTPTAVDVYLRVAAVGLASSWLRVFAPSSRAAAPNGQRLAVPEATSVIAFVKRRATPIVTAITSTQLLRPGGPVRERVRVSGLGGSSTSVQAELFGPFPARASIVCTGVPYWQRAFSVRGERWTQSPAVRLRRAGFYALRDRVAAGEWTECGLAPRTVLATPRIVTGRGDVSAHRRALGRGTATPVRLQIPELRIRAPIVPVGIDARRGVLDVPASIRRIGWWRDGAAPGDPSGTVLIAGHLDSARAGRGALSSLPRAEVGERVRVETAAGDVLAYRIVSVRSFPKSELPLNVYRSGGAPRLVLVTCGGPFDAASGHYLDNIVVTAVPV
jgi:hypothetical protein